MNLRVWLVVVVIGSFGGASADSDATVVRLQMLFDVLFCPVADPTYYMHPPFCIRVHVAFLFSFDLSSFPLCTIFATTTSVTPA
jgi:hypothetical protein